MNTKCRAYEDLYMAYITRDAAEEKLFDNPQLFNTPIVRNGKFVTIGYCPEAWEKGAGLVLRVRAEKLSGRRFFWNEGQAAP